MTAQPARLERNLFEFDYPAFAEDALCAQVDPEIYFPEIGRSTRDARRICAQCPVREECLAYALAHDERYGVWAGLTYRERRKLAGGRQLKDPSPAPGVCRIAECSLPVRATVNGRGWTAYCSTEHAALAVVRRTGKAMP